MPFDGRPVLIPHVARLEILRGLLALQRRPGQQGSFATCLWSAASRHPDLLATGLAPYVDDREGRPPTDPIAAAAVFGLTRSIWSNATKCEKLTYIRDAISCLPAELLSDDEAVSRVGLAFPDYRDYCTVRSRRRFVFPFW